MKFDRKAMRLYAITDNCGIESESLYNKVEKAIKGGATFIQLREKNLSFDELLDEAKAINILCKQYNVPFVINDNVDIARLSGADGVHLGQNDTDVETARKILGDNKIIGASARTVEDALAAQKKGADYLGVGAVFATSTKLDAKNISKDLLKQICDAVNIPVVAIGGINKSNILELCGTNIDGVAVVSAVFGQKDIQNAAKELYKLTEKIILV